MKNKSGKYSRDHIFTLKELKKLPKSRKEAMAKGMKFYFNGNLCKHNHLSPRRPDSKCKQCVAERDNERYKEKTEGKAKRVRNLEELTKITKEQSRENAIANKDRYFLAKCSKCSQLKIFDSKQRATKCIECSRKYSKEKAKKYYRAKPPKKGTYNTIENTLLISAKNRAIKKGIEFSIDYKDVVIPDRCPVLGIKINRFLEDTSQSNKSRASSPSLDRLDNSKGYVKGNVAVMSYRANVLKGQGTSKQHYQIAKWMRKNMLHC